MPERMRREISPVDRVLQKIIDWAEDVVAASKRGRTDGVNRTEALHRLTLSLEQAAKLETLLSFVKGHPDDDLSREILASLSPLSESGSSEASKSTETLATLIDRLFDDVESRADT